MQQSGFQELFQQQWAPMIEKIKSNMDEADFGQLLKNMDFENLTQVMLKLNHHDDEQESKQSK